MLKHAVIVNDAIPFKQEGMILVVDHDIVQVIVGLAYQGPDLIHHHIHLQIIDALLSAGIGLPADIADKFIVLKVEEEILPSRVLFLKLIYGISNQGQIIFDNFIVYITGVECHRP
ncbi:hypothetical protein AB4124_20230 [Paenibacillus sp. 2KB_20]|uniref:hypothetical protein n=1 Tax=Paenibacillus sp. 2KB_20 TaxID=3232977 RepID=UPI003F9986C4